jgi:hypothetical protein
MLSAHQLVRPVIESQEKEPEPEKKSRKKRTRLPGEKLLKDYALKNRKQHPQVLNQSLKMPQTGWGAKSLGVKQMMELQRKFHQQHGGAMRIPPGHPKKPVIPRMPIPVISKPPRGGRRLVKPLVQSGFGFCPSSQLGGCLKKSCKKKKKKMKGRGVTMGGGGVTLAGARARQGGGSIGCQRGGGTLGCQQGGGMALGCQSGGGTLGCQAGGGFMKTLNRAGRSIRKGANKLGKSVVNMVEHNPLAIPAIALGAATGGLASLPAAAVMGASAALPMVGQELARVSGNKARRKQELVARARGMQAGMRHLQQQAARDPQSGQGIMKPMMDVLYSEAGQRAANMLGQAGQTLSKQALEQIVNMVYKTAMRGMSPAEKKQAVQPSEIKQFVQHEGWDIEGCSNPKTKRLAKAFIGKLFNYMGINLDNPETAQKGRNLANCVGRALCQMVEGVDGATVFRSVQRGINRFFRGKPQRGRGFWKNVGKSITNNPETWAGNY